MGCLRLWTIAAALAVAVAGDERKIREGHAAAEAPLGGVQRLRAQNAINASAGPVQILIELRSKPMRGEIALRSDILGEQESLIQSLERGGGRILHRYRLLGLVAAEVPVELLETIRAYEDVAGVSLDRPMEFQIDRSVPAMAVTRPWADGYTGSGESVLLFDTGVNANHPALQGRVQGAPFLTGANCLPEEASSAADFDGHGTHMAGVIASAGTAAQPGFQGVARGLSTVVNAKIACRGEPVFSSMLLAAIEAALLARSAPIALSAAVVPTEEDDGVFSRAIDSLIDRFNLIWINAAGNFGPDAYTVASPATAYNGISVANLDLQGTSQRDLAIVAESSGRGPTLDGRFKPDVAAPGSNVFSTDYASDGFVSRSGTSVAAAHVAGTAAILRQAGVQDRLAMKALLINTTDRDGWDTDQGWGFVNAERAYLQREYVRRGTVPAISGSAVYYRAIVAPGAAYFATLTWNRALSGASSSLRNLDLSAYRADNAAVVRRSLFLNQNVEQIAFRNTGSEPVSYIVRVESRNGGATDEPFALASSLPLDSFDPPKLNMNCTFPGAIAPGAPAEVVCNLANGGGLPFFDVELTVVSRGNPLGEASTGAMPASSTKTVSIPLTSPVVPGEYPLNVRAAGFSFGLVENVLADGTLTVTAPAGSQPLIATVTNGASFESGFTAGSWVTITGAQLAATTRTWAASDFNGDLLPVELDGVRVTINGQAAYPAYISPAQINVLAPDDVTEGEANVEVINTLGRSAVVKASKQAIAPAFFTMAMGGSTYVAATAADGTPIGPAAPARPARPGETISLYATGCGPTNPPVPAGRLVATPGALTAPVEITLDEFDGQVTFAGIVSPGLCQINLVVPDIQDTDAELPVSLLIGGVSSHNEPLLAIRRQD